MKAIPHILILKVNHDTVNNNYIWIKKKLYFASEKKQHYYYFSLISDCMMGVVVQFDWRISWHWASKKLIENMAGHGHVLSQNLRKFDHLREELTTPWSTFVCRQYCVKVAWLALPVTPAFYCGSTSEWQGRDWCYHWHSTRWTRLRWGNLQWTEETI